MQTRPLGPGAPPVSAVSFGAMPLSTAGRPAEARALTVLRAALDLGLTLIDTADVYCHDDRDIGHNEWLLARALRDWPGDRARIIVATKGGLTRPRGAWEHDGRPEHLRQACDRSLAALDVERIDLYQLHAPDTTVPFADTIGALADLQAQGKIRWVGLSNVSVPEIEAARRQVEIVTVQNRLSPFFREALRTGVVEHCRRLGIGFLAYSPVGGGRLNLKLPAHPVVSAIAREHGATAHQVVLAWVLAQAPNVIVIPGARSVEHVRGSAGAAGLELRAEQLRAIDEGEFSRA
jgi:aryl-alcohol dehydrogenase-like predicted oxidoreductase